MQVGLHLVFEQWGNVEMNKNAEVYQALPVALNNFFQGCATWNNADGSARNDLKGNLFSLAISSDTKNVIIGVSRNDVNLGIRYIVTGN